MKKKLLLPSALLGALLFAAPAMAETHEIDDLDGITIGDVNDVVTGTAGETFAGVYINVANNIAHYFDGTNWESKVTGGSVTTGDIYKIDGFVIDFSDQANLGAKRIAGVLGEDTGGHYELLGDIGVLGLFETDDFELSGFAATITDGSISLKNVTVTNWGGDGSQDWGTGNTVGVNLGTSAAATVFSGDLSTGTITVYGGTGDATGFSLWGSVEGGASQVFNIGNIVVEAESTANARGIANIVGDDTSVFTVANTISVTNWGAGSAVGVFTDSWGTGNAEVTVSGIIVVDNQDDGSAVGIHSMLDDDEITLSGTIISTIDSSAPTSDTDPAAMGIYTEGNNAIVNLTSGSVIDARDVAVGFDGNGGTLNIGDEDGVFTNAGLVFVVDGATAINFEGDAALARAGFKGDVTQTFNLGSNTVYGIIDLDVAGATFNTGDEDGLFRTYGNVTVIDGASAGVKTITIADSGKVEFLGDFTITTGNNTTVTVAGDSTFAFDASKTAAGIDVGAGTLEIDLTDGNLVVHGEAFRRGVVVGVSGGTYQDLSAKVSSNGQITGWKVSEDMKLERYNLDYANMNDGFLAAGMIHNRYTGYNMVRDRFISAQRRAGSGYFGQAPCDPCTPVGPCDEVCNPCDPCGTGFGSGSASRSTWVNYVGRGTDFGIWDIGVDGVQVGSDLFKTRTTQFGLIFGYEGGWAKADSHSSTIPPGFTDRVDSKDTYFGFYGARVFRNGFDGRFVYNHGWQKFDMTRYHSGNRYTSDFKGRTNEINLELGRRTYNGAWSMRPFGAMDIYTVHLGSSVDQWDGAEEPGGVNEVTSLFYHKLDKTQVFLRFGTDLRYQVKRFTFNSGLTYAYDVKGDKYESRVALANPDARNEFSTLRGAKWGRELLSMNVGGEYQLGQCFSVFGGYEGQAVLDRSGGFQSVGYVGGAVKW